MNKCNSKLKNISQDTVINSFKNLETSNNDDLLLCPEHDYLPDYKLRSSTLKVQNALSEFNTQTLKDQARKNLGIIDPVTIDKEFSLESDNAIANKSVAKAFNNVNSLIQEITPIKVKWSPDSNLNTFTTAGIYEISGERFNTFDNIPGLEGKQYIGGTLVVLESLNEVNRAYITQMLLLSSQLEGDAYIRSAVIDKIHTNNNNFTPWCKLQKNQEVGTIYGENQYDKYTEEAVISGICVLDVQRKNIESFILTVINNTNAVEQAFQLGSDFNKSVVQFKQSINLQGVIQYKTRVYNKNTWSAWKNVGEDCVPIDTQLSNVSANPVQNKVITEALEQANTLIEQEQQRATNAEEILSNRISENVSRTSDIEQILETSPNMLNILADISNWIQEDTSGSSNLILDVNQNKNDINKLKLQTHGIEVTTTGNRFTIIPEIKAGDKVNITLTDATNQDVPLYILVRYGSQGAVKQVRATPINVGDVVKVEATVDFDRIQLWANGMSDEFTCHLLFTTDDMTLRKVIENTEQQLIASMEEQREELVRRIQGKSENSTKEDAFRVLGSYSTIAQLQTAISSIDTFTDKGKGEVSGKWRAYIDSNVFEIDMKLLVWNSIPSQAKWIQTIKSNYKANNEDNLTLSTRVHELSRTWNWDTYINTWSPWESINKDLDNAKSELEAKIKETDDRIAYEEASDILFTMPAKLIPSGEQLKPDNTVTDNIINALAYYEVFGSNGNYEVQEFKVKKGEIYYIEYRGNFADAFCPFILKDEQGNVYFKVRGRIDYETNDERHFIKIKKDGWLCLSVYVPNNTFSVYKECRQKNKYFVDEVLWVGTSIPDEGKYPERVAEELGFTLYNKAKSSSGIVKPANENTSSIRYVLNLSETVDEMLAKLQSDKGNTGLSDAQLNWYIGANINTGVKHARRVYDDDGNLDKEATAANYNDFYGPSYEDTILPYIDGTLANCKMIVWDHGYNDGRYITKQVQAGYDSINWESTDRSTYTGAFRYLLETIYAVNPEIIVVIAGYFSDNHHENSANYNTKDVCTMQQWVAEKYNLPLIPVWDLLHISDDIVIGSEGKSLPGKNGDEVFPDGFSSHRQFCTDTVHPSVGEPGTWNYNERSIELYTQAMLKGMRDLPGYAANAVNDDVLSETSTNGVQNKVVKAAIDSQRKELLKRIQGTSDNSSASKDSFKVLGSYTETTLGELISAMDAMHAANANSGYEGVWRAYIGNDYITIRNIPVGYAADKWMQIVSGRFTPDHNGNPIMVTQYREWVRTHNYNYDDFADIEGWSVWQKTTKQFETEIANLHSEINTLDNAIRVVPKQLGTFSVISELLAVLDGMCPQGGENSYEKYIAYVGKEQVTVENNRRVDGETTVWHQTLRCHRRLSSVRNSKNIVYGDGGTGILIDYTQSFDFPSYSPTTSLYHDNTVYGEYCRKKIYYSTSATKESGVWNRWEDMNNPYHSMQSYAKRIAIFGGSFVQYMGGVWEDVDKSKYAFTHAGRRYFLVDYLAERLNAKYFDDYAVGGNGNSITTDSAGDSVFAYNTYFQVERSFNTDRATPANQLDDNSNVYDIYIIMLGINDYAKNIEVGKATDDKNLSGTSATFCSSLKKSIDYIRANAPNAKILMITPFKAYKYAGNTVDFGWNLDTYTTNDKGYKFLDYVRAFKEVAYVTSCPCYDLLSMQNFSGMNVDMYYTDGTHPNGLGYYKVADMLAEFIATGVGHGFDKINSGGSSVTIDSALSTTSTNAVQNKAIAQAIEAAVERGRLLALRNLYVEAGAEYNDTGYIIKKTAFWGEEVDHQPGCYYLNGLGDITEEQMAYIYRMKDSMTIFLASDDIARGRFWQDMGDARLRTLFGANNYGRWLTDKTIGGANPFASMKIEVIKWTNTSGLATSGAALAMKTSSDAFFQNTALKVIDRFMPNKDCSFGQVTNLAELRLWATNFNINLSTNQKISKSSIIYTIENVLKTTSKTLLITLHPNVYAKCVEGGEWYEEVIAALNTANGYTNESGEEITGTITGGGSINIVSA